MAGRSSDLPVFLIFYRHFLRVTHGLRHRSILNTQRAATLGSEAVFCDVPGCLKSTRQLRQKKLLSFEYVIRILNRVDKMISVLLRCFDDDIPVKKS